MPVLYISEAEVVRDPAALFNHVRSGYEVVVEREGSPIALVLPPGEKEPSADAEYDAWFVAQIDQALADPRASIASEDVEAYFAKRRHAAALKIIGMTG